MALVLTVCSPSPMLVVHAAAAKRTLYGVLGVKPEATQEEMKKAYRREAIKWHPDKNKDRVDEANRRFKDIQEAYDTLKDPRSRGDYDDSLRDPRRTSGHGGGYAHASTPGAQEDGDFFSAGFYSRMRGQAAAEAAARGRREGGRAGGGQYTHNGHDRSFEGVRVNLFDIFRFGLGERENLGVPKARWRHLHVKLSVSLEELLTGVVKEVDVSDSIVERYKQAHRTGLLSDVVQEGAAVFGALLLRCPLPISAVAFAAYVHLKLPRVPKGTFQVPILPGYRAGTKITFSTPDGVNVTFEIVEKTSDLRRSGDDLFVMVKLSPEKAKKGCTVKVPTLDRGKLSVRLKAREVRDGYERRFSGLGMPRRKGPERSRGDLVVHFFVADGGL